MTVYRQLYNNLFVFGCFLDLHFYNIASHRTSCIIFVFVCFSFLHELRKIIKLTLGCYAVMYTVTHLRELYWPCSLCRFPLLVLLSLLLLDSAPPDSGNVLSVSRVGSALTESERKQEREMGAHQS